MKQAATTYFDGEGRDFSRACIDHSVEWCVNTNLSKLVIFTGTGDGPHYAGREILSDERYQHLQVIAVTPPAGRSYRTNPNDPNSPVVRAGVNPAMVEELSELGIKVVAAHLPFKGIHNGISRTSEWDRVAEAYGVLGGGFALCIQAALIACDAGMVESGERVVVASADTAMAVIACRTESFLSPTDGLLVEHIICRPMRYSISKPKHHLSQQMWVRFTAPQARSEASEGGPGPKPSLMPTLPPSTEPTESKTTSSKSAGRPSRSKKPKSGE